MIQQTFKSMEEALAEMLQWYWYRTGLDPAAEPGDILRTLFEAVAYEVEAITEEFDAAIQRAVPEGVFQAFGFERQPAQPARLVLRFSRATPAPEAIPIPAGTRAQTPGGVGFRTLQDAVLPLGATYVDVAAEAEVPGALGNVPAGAVSQVKDALPGIEAVTNPTPGTGGQDEEPLEAQKARFARYIASLAKGTLGALEVAALSAYDPASQMRPERALAVDAARDPSVPVGTVIVYVDALPAAPSTLLSAVAAACEPVRPAGVVLSVQAVAHVTVDVRVRLEGGAPQDVLPAQQAVQAVFAALGIGEDVVRERLVAAIAPAVSAYAVRVVAPASDVAVGPYQRAVLGTVTVEVA
ncbi:baseplate J/gp47 family protein [Thermus sp. 93170]|uniref:baseplate J/gp47 family protein n=1 Tax=Thermus sp. 93170 TaxID=1046939 RepID=UPI003F42628C